MFYKKVNPTSHKEAAGERSQDTSFRIRWMRAPTFCKAQRMSTEKSLGVRIARPIAFGPSVYGLTVLHSASFGATDPLENSRAA